jgi:GxxExxY protein
VTVRMESSAAITGQIIQCAIEVHRALGPGLREKTYDEALAIEMLERGVPFERQVRIPVEYKGHLVGEYGLDFIVSTAVVVEVKAVDRIEPVFEAQILSYLRASGLRLGLLVNFNSRRLADGIRRFIL